MQRTCNKLVLCLINVIDIYGARNNGLMVPRFSGVLLCLSLVKAHVNCDFFLE